MTRILSALLLTMMVFLAACGGGDDDGDAEPLPTVDQLNDRPLVTPDPDITPEITPEAPPADDPPVAPPADSDMPPEATDDPPTNGALPPFAGNDSEPPPFALTPDTGNGAPVGPPIDNPGGPPNVGNNPPGNFPPGDNNLPPNIGNNNIPGGFDTNFNITVTGAVEMSMQEGTSTFAITPARTAGGVEVPEHLTLTIFAGELEEINQLVIEFPSETTPGTYDLTGEAFYTGAAITARYDDYDPTTEVFLTFFQNMNGTVTFTEIGATISGSVQFTADAADPAGNLVSISVTGEFQGVAFQG